MSNSKAKRTKSIRVAELEKRGWTKELRTAYLARNFSTYYRDDAEEAEKRPDWQRDARRAAEGKRVFYSTADLKERGWTNTMIKKLLGEPDCVIPLSTTGVQVAYRYYASVVNEIESTDEFRTRLAAAEKRSQRGREISRQRAHEALEFAREQVKQLQVYPPRSWAALKSLAVKHKQAYYCSRSYYEYDASSAEDETVERWCENYLRHECSNYDWMLQLLRDKFSGMPGVNDIYDQVVRPEADKLVADAITTLKSKEMAPA